MEDLDFAMQLADAADKLTTAGFGQVGPIKRKPDGSSVTTHDVATERALVELVAKRFPTDATLGEETGATGDSFRRWIFDPIDGTKYFVSGDPNWGTLIALEVNGEIRLGVASAPMFETRWWASVGGGAYKNGERIRVSGVRELSGARIAYRAHEGIVGTAHEAPLERLARSCKNRYIREAFQRYMTVAEGTADLGANVGPDIWDLAAPSVIIREAGGRMTAFDGSSSLRARTVLASNGHLHEEALSFLQERERFDRRR